MAYSESSMGSPALRGLNWRGALRWFASTRRQRFEDFGSAEMIDGGLCRMVEVENE